MHKKSKWDVQAEAPVVPEQDFIKLAQDAAKKINDQISSSSGTSHTLVNGAYIKEIDINDVPNRFVLTKGATHDEILKETRCVCVARGRFYKEGEKPGMGDERPLYLTLTTSSEDNLNRAIQMIEKLMQTPSTYLGKVYLGMNEAPQGFSIPANVIGPKGLYVKYITHHANGTRVQLKGKGSGFKEMETGEESNEPLHLHLTAPSKDGLNIAKALADNLLCKVRRDFLKFLENNPQNYQNYLDRYYSQSNFIKQMEVIQAQQQQPTQVQQPMYSSFISPQMYIQSTVSGGPMYQDDIVETYEEYEEVVEPVEESNTEKRTNDIEYSSNKKQKH